MSRFNSSIVVFRGSSSTSIYIDYEGEGRMLTTLLFPRGSLWKGVVVTMEKLVDFERDRLCSYVVGS